MKWTIIWGERSYPFKAPHWRTTYQRNQLQEPPKLDKRCDMTLLSPTNMNGVTPSSATNSFNQFSNLHSLPEKSESMWHANLTWSVLNDTNRCHSTTTFPTSARNLCPCPKKKRVTQQIETLKFTTQTLLLLIIHGRDAIHVHMKSLFCKQNMLFVSTADWASSCLSL